jgi:hypothetical protein
MPTPAVAGPNHGAWGGADSWRTIRTRCRWPSSVDGSRLVAAVVLLAPLLVLPFCGAPAVVPDCTPAPPRDTWPLPFLPKPATAAALSLASATLTAVRKASLSARALSPP